MRPTVGPRVAVLASLGSTDFMRVLLEAILSHHAREKLHEIPMGVQWVKVLPRTWNVRATKTPGP